MSTEELISKLTLGNFDTMSNVSGYCLKCKNYGPIKNGTLIKMSNGRTRMAGTCSMNGCDGKISKIVSWLFTDVV